MGIGGNLLSVCVCTREINPTLPSVEILHGHPIKASFSINILIHTGAVWSKLSGNIRKAPSTLSYCSEDQREAGCLRWVGPFAFSAIILSLTPGTSQIEQANQRESCGISRGPT